MTCRSAGLFVFEMSGPPALVAKIRLIPLLVPLAAVHSVAAYSRLVRCRALAVSVVGLGIVGIAAVLFVGPGSEVSPGALRAFLSQIHS